jgi:hypothetical protein
MDRMIRGPCREGVTEKIDFNCLIKI